MTAMQRRGSDQAVGGATQGAILNYLISFARGIDHFNDTVGRTVAWFALAMVIVQFMVVVLRYVFGVGSIFMQESIVYMHGILFMLGAAYTLLHDGHVRIDIFYRETSEQRKALVNLIGTPILLIPICTVIFLYSWPYVASSWRVFEGSKETSGIQGVFLLKTIVLVFAVMLALQGLSLAIRSLLVLTGCKSGREHQEFAER